MSDTTLNRDELNDLTVDDLKALAVEAGAEAEAVASLRKKAEIIDVIEQHIDIEATVNNASASVEPEQAPAPTIRRGYISADKSGKVH